MFGKRTSGRLFGILLALVYVSLVVSAFCGLWARVGVWATTILLVVLGIGFYCAGVWAAVDRPAELDKKIPVSSRELGRRNKNFYDWLASLGKTLRP
jgi:hypothetical protein